MGLKGEYGEVHPQIGCLFGHPGLHVPMTFFFYLKIGLDIDCISAKC